MRVIDGIRRAWRDHVAGPRLRTYDAACEELGGAPWRALPEATDRWFIANRVEPTPDVQSTIDTDVISLRPKRSATTRLLVVGGVALFAIALAVELLGMGGGARFAPAAVAPMAAAPAPAAPTPAAPAPTAAAPAPVRTTSATAAPLPVRTHRAAASSSAATRSTPHASAHKHAHTHAAAPAHATPRHHGVARHRRR